MASFEGKWAFSTLVLQCQIYKVYRHSRRKKTVSGKCVEGTHATNCASPKKSVAKAAKTATKRPPTKAASNRPAKAAEPKRTPKASKKTVQPVAVENARPPQTETKGGKILALI